MLRIAAGGLAIKHQSEALHDRFGGRTVHLGEHHETGGALDQRVDRGADASTLDQVALPVAAYSDKRDQPFRLRLALSC